MAITSGIARPSACGHEMTSTVTVRVMASPTSPSSVQTTNVTAAARGRQVEERGGGAVGERLGARARALRLGDETLNAGQRGVLADPVDADAQRRVGRDRAGDHAIALTPPDRPRLAGDHRLVHVRRPVDDLAVGRNTRARPDQDDIARGQRRDRHRLDRPVPNALGLVGQQLGERLQRAARLADRPHLQPVAEQHDHDQRGELPPELEVEQPQHRRRAGDERDA